MLKQLWSHAVSEFRQIDISVHKLRQFGYIVGGGFVVISLLSLWHIGAVSFVSGICGTVGTVLLLAGMTVPRVLRIPYRMWMGLAVILGFFVSNVILTILYYFILTPIGLLQRFFGADPLNRRYDFDAESYWIPRMPPVQDSMKRPF